MFSVFGTRQLLIRNSGILHQRLRINLTHPCYGARHTPRFTDMASERVLTCSRCCLTPVRSYGRHLGQLPHFRLRNVLVRNLVARVWICTKLHHVGDFPSLPGPWTCSVPPIWCYALGQHISSWAKKEPRLQPLWCFITRRVLCRHLLWRHQYSISFVEVVLLDRRDCTFSRGAYGFANIPT